MSQEQASGYVKAETHNRVTTIEFFHPQSNSLPAKLLAELSHEIHVAANSYDTQVLILRSAGERAFCAGASFNELLELENAAQGNAFFNGFASVINAIRVCPKMVIGRIQGNCVGGGVGLAAATDYCIAWQDVSIKLSELSIGLAPLVIGPALERKIGLSAYSQLAIDSTMWRNADWAKRKGLFAEVHPSIENMDESVSRLANTLAHSNPEAMSSLKKVLWKGTEHWGDLLKERAKITGELAVSEHTRNAIRQFKSKAKS